MAAALHSAAAGLATFSPGILPELLDADRPNQNGIVGAFNSGALGDGPEHLTSREREVLEMMMEGLSNKEIAVHLAISVHTVKFHISSILGKLDASSRTEAITIGLRRGLITI
jgi:DNA-binding NarL/FixJ family response regulator